MLDPNVGRMHLRLVLGLISMGAVWGNLDAQDQPKPVPRTLSKTAPQESRAEDRAAIRETVRQFAEAFQKRDAEAAAAFMTEGASLVPAEAEPIRGRAEIQKAYAAHFEKEERPTFKLEPTALDFPSRDTAVEAGIMTITTTVGKLTETSKNQYEILYVRENGQWLIANLREWPLPTSGIEDLEWLIGTWSAKQPEAEVFTTYEWFGNKSYILVRFFVREKDKSLTGMQLIGTDPATNSLRTWTFEKDGGFGEGSCHRDGNTWVFETATTLADGNLLTAANLLVPIDGNTFTWQPVNLTVDGEEIIDLPPVKVTRVESAK